MDAQGNLTVGGCNPYLDIGVLATEGFLRSADTVKSAKTSLNTTATNDLSGSYGWFAGVGGLVDSYPTHVKGLYP